MGGVAHNLRSVLRQGSSSGVSKRQSSEVNVSVTRGLLSV